MRVPGLRSPYDKVGGIYYIGRMFDKIRLHAEGKLPAEYHPNLGKQFDARTLTFLNLDYPSLIQRVSEGGTDLEILDWCYQTGRHPTDTEVFVWNEFLRKRGWNDDGSPTLRKRLAEIHCEHRTDIQTSFDYIELDEDRDPGDHPRSFEA